MENNDIQTIKKENLSDINSPRKATIDRTEIYYGQTPLGIRKMQLEKLASKENLDLVTLCNQIIVMTGEERFLMLKNHYIYSDQAFQEFFNNFENYTIQKSGETKYKKRYKLNTEMPESSHSSENFTSKTKKQIRQKYDNATKSKDERTSSKIPKTIKDTKVIASTSGLNSSSNDYTISANNINYKNNLKQNKLVSKYKGDYETELNCPLITKTNTGDHNINNGEYKSIITSLLFDDSDSRLKQIIKSKDNSPKKYDTILERLLFE